MAGACHHRARSFPVVALWTIVTEAGSISARIPAGTGRRRAIVRLADLQGHPAGVPAGQPDRASPSVLLWASRSASRSEFWSASASGRTRRLWPVLLFFQAIGDIAWLPILVIWFGYGLTTMTFVIVYTVIFPVVLNTVLGVRSIPVDLASRRAESRRLAHRVLWEVILPGALPNIITGLRNGLGYGWRALIATEIIVGTSGIGFMMFDARRAGSVVEILLGMIILGILWYIVDSWILAPIERATGQRWGLVTR